MQGRKRRRRRNTRNWKERLSIFPRYCFLYISYKCAAGNGSKVLPIFFRKINILSGWPHKKLRPKKLLFHLGVLSAEPKWAGNSGVACEQVTVSLFTVNKNKNRNLRKDAAQHGGRKNARRERWVRVLNPSHIKEYEGKAHGKYALNTWEASGNF